MQTAQTADVRPAQRQRWSRADDIDEFVDTRCLRAERCALRAEDFVLLVIE